MYKKYKDENDIAVVCSQSFSWNCLLTKYSSKSNLFLVQWVFLVTGETEKLYSLTVLVIPVFANSLSTGSSFENFKHSALLYSIIKIPSNMSKYPLMFSQIVIVIHLEFHLGNEIFLQKWRVECKHYSKGRFNTFK